MLYFTILSFGMGFSWEGKKKKSRWLVWSVLVGRLERGALGEHGLHVDHTTELRRAAHADHAGDLAW